MVDIYINFTFTRNAQKRKIYFIVFKFSNGSSFFFFFICQLLWVKAAKLVIKSFSFHKQTQLQVLLNQGRPALTSCSRQRMLSNFNLKLV